MIIVTGASRGLGKAICDRLLEKKYSVLGLARNTEHLSFENVECDVSSYESIKDVARALKRDKHSITALINVAGIASMNLALTTPPKTSKSIIETNLLGTIYCSQLIAPFMVRNRQGSIINFSTIAVALGLKGESIYVASKAGVEGFTRSFAREMADFNINVNCIAPGPIDTDLIKGVSKPKIDAIVQQQIINKQFSTDAVCDMVELLLDKRSNSISGQVLNVGGV